MDDKYRIIKIGKEALYEYIYENLIAQHEQLLDLDVVECRNDFAIDWEEGTFIFIASKGEDDKGKFLPFPKEIDLNVLLKRLPDTTDSVLSHDKHYKDYSLEELKDLCD